MSVVKAKSAHARKPTFRKLSLEVNFAPSWQSFGPRALFPRSGRLTAAPKKETSINEVSDPWRWRRMLRLQPDIER